MHTWKAQLSWDLRLSALSLLPKEKNDFAVPSGPEFVFTSAEKLGRAPLASFFTGFLATLATGFVAVLPIAFFTCGVRWAGRELWASSVQMRARCRRGAAPSS